MAGLVYRSEMPALGSLAKVGIADIGKPSHPIAILRSSAGRPSLEGRTGNVDPPKL